jgi:hypothetical protein
VRVIYPCSAAQCNAEERNSPPDLVNPHLADFQYHADDWPPRCAPLIYEVVRFVVIIEHALSSRQQALTRCLPCSDLGHGSITQSSHLRFTTCIASSCGLLNTELKDNDAFVAVDRGYVDIDLVLKQIKTFSVTPLRQEMRQISQTVFCGTTTCCRCLISRFLDCLSEAV